MPLLGLFAKKSKSPLKASSDTTSNVSIGDNEWVSVNTVAVASPSSEHPQRLRRQLLQHSQQSASSSALSRPSNDDSVYDPPIRQSSLFPLQGDRSGIFRSTQSLPGHSDSDTKSPVSQKFSGSPPLLPVSKKSFFNWTSSKDRSHTIPPVKAISDFTDPSFNLKSFRHVRPESPNFDSSSSTTLLPRSPSPATPTLIPVPTSTLPPPPVSFQVMSRKPRPPPVLSPLSFPHSQSSSSQSLQPRIVAGAFRQAARRSTTSLMLGDPVVSPGTMSEDTNAGSLSFECDINKAFSALSSSPPKLSLSSFSNSSKTDVSNISNSTLIPRPPRSHPPPNFSQSSTYTQINYSSASIPLSSSAVTLNSPLLPATSSPTLIPAVNPARVTPSSLKPSAIQMLRSNTAGGSSSESTDSEAELESGDDSDTGIPRVSRKRTVRSHYTAINTDSGPLATTNTPEWVDATAPAPSRPSTIALETSNSKTYVTSVKPAPFANVTSRPRLTENATSLERFSVSAFTPVDNSPRLSPASNVYPNGGTRPRASASVGAQHPTIEEARTSATFANSRLSAAANSTSPKKKTRKPSAWNVDTDTSESSESESDPENSDEDDAPLSKLVPPKRPGTSLSSYSTNSDSSLRKKPLIDMSSLSTFSGRPIGAPAPIAREEEEMPKPRILVDIAGRASPNFKNLSPSIKVVSPLQSSQLSSPLLHLDKRLSKAPLSSTSAMSSPSSSGASLSASSRDVRGASSDTSVSPIDYFAKYHSFANGDTNFTGDNSNTTKPSVGPSSMKSSTAAGSPTISLSPAIPPMRPFQRRESPATSSTGDSSSGKVPLTPKDGNDICHDNRASTAIVSVKEYPPRPTHGRKSSVTFEDETRSPDKFSGNVYSKVKENNPDAGEARRRERRRSEARAAIELGKVVNGPPPIDVEATGFDPGVQITWPQLGMQMPMQAPMPMSVQPMIPMGGVGGGMGTMGMPTQLQMGFMPSNDPAFVVAHQQAMSIAKQAYQYAVAQQALAAANDEWERTSTMTGFMPVNPGYMNMRGSMLFPPAPVSMYAGNTGGMSGGGSLINGFGGTGGWGETRSVYGQSFGPATSMGARLSNYSSTDLMAFNPATMAASTSVGNVGSGSGFTQGQQRPGVRQRTRTAPSSSSPPIPNSNPPPLPSPTKSAIRARAPAPPSSFRGVPQQ